MIGGKNHAASPSQRFYGKRSANGRGKEKPTEGNRETAEADLFISEAI